MQARGARAIASAQARKLSVSSGPALPSVPRLLTRAAPHALTLHVARGEVALAVDKKHALERALHELRVEERHLRVRALGVVEHLAQHSLLRVAHGRARGARPAKLVDEGLVLGPLAREAVGLPLAVERQVAQQHLPDGRAVACGHAAPHLLAQRLGVAVAALQ